MDSDHTLIIIREALETTGVNVMDSLLSVEDIEIAVKRVGGNLSKAQIESAFKEILENKEREKIYYNELEVMLQKHNIGITNEKQLPKTNTFTPIGFQTVNNLAFISKNCLKNAVLCDIDIPINMELIKYRIRNGYGINPQRNIEFFKMEIQKGKKIDNGLIDFWKWILDCKNYKKEPVGQKEGIMIDPCIGIKAILEIDKEESCLYKQAFFIFEHFVMETEKRLQALNICGWTDIAFNNKESQEKLKEICAKHYENGDYIRASAIAVFHFDFIQAYEYLKADIKNDSINFLKGVLFGLKNLQITIENNPILIKEYFKKINFDDDVNINENLENLKDLENLKKFDIFEKDLSESEEFNSAPLEIQKNVILNSFNFIKKLCANANFDNPYLKSICKFIANETRGKSQYILNDTQISFFDRIAYAIRFNETNELRDFFSKYEGFALSKGLIEIIIILGSTPTAIDILQKHMDLTFDVQTVGLCSIHLMLLRFPNENKLDQWYINYRELLNRLQFYNERTLLDKEYQKHEKIYFENLKLKDSITKDFKPIW